MKDLWTQRSMGDVIDDCVYFFSPLSAIAQFFHHTHCPLHQRQTQGGFRTQHGTDTVQGYSDVDEEENTKANSHL